MSLSERSRSAIYTGLQTIVDEEAVQEMLSYFPARDVEEPVTKEFLRAELTLVRMEMGAMEARLREEIHTAVRAQTQWLVGVMLTLAAVVVAAVALVS